MNGVQFTRPLLFAEPACESPSLSGMKSDIETIINSYKVQGTISTASVYVREFKNAEWISINEQEKYSPGSLLKVPELIAFYKMNENNPGILDKVVTYQNALSSNKNTNFNSKHIELGKSYSVKELLRYMIEYSDNDATMILNSMIDKNTFGRVFTDLGLSEPDYKAVEFKITANEYSLFMKELYNGSYLTKANSEACLSLLNKCNFNSGLMKGLPANCIVAHKFGEGGLDNAPNFSESGIIYCGNTPYLVTIMTKGKDMKMLPLVVSDISKKVYEKMSSRS